MESRKIQLVGNRSFAVSLPKQWAVKNHLKNHDQLHMRESATGELLLSTTRQETPSLKEVAAQIKHVSLISEFLVFCYMKNVDAVRLRASPLTFEMQREIRRVILYLEGYEITQEDAHEVQIKFVFSEVTMTMPAIHRRMLYLIRMEFDSLVRKDKATMAELEMGTDRLFHLSNRILFACMRDRTLRERNGIGHEEDMYFSTNIAKRLENIADYLLKLKDATLSPQDEKQLSGLLDLLDRLVHKRQGIAELSEEFDTLKVSSKDPAVNTILHRIADLSYDILDALISIEFNNQKTDVI